MMKVGVVGLGTVGGTLRDALEAMGSRRRVTTPIWVWARPRCSLIARWCSCVSRHRRRPTGELDTSAVWKAVRDVEANLADGTIIAIKSTVPPGTSDALRIDFPRFEFASVPEFLVAARPMETLTHPDRVVIGARTDRGVSRARRGDAQRSRLGRRS